MFVVGVAKKWWNHRQTHPRASKVPFVYAYDDSGRFLSFRIKTWQIPFYKRKVVKLQSFQCTRCGLKFKSIKNSKPNCPNCR